jgi:hypothetical protein
VGAPADTSYGLGRGRVPLLVMIASMMVSMIISMIADYSSASSLGFSFS